MTEPAASLYAAGVTRGGQISSLTRFQTDALECLYQHRLLSTTQIVRLLTPQAASTRYARHQLGRLCTIGLVEFVRLGRRREKAWFSTSAGAEVAETGQIRVRPYRMTAPKAAGPIQAHTLAVNEVGIVFVETARARGEECTPLDWQPEVAHRISDGIGHRFDEDHLIADAVLHYVTVSPDGRRTQLRFFIELDRATMTSARLAKKLSRYGQYYEYTLATSTQSRRPTAADIGRLAWRDRYPRFPKILVVLTGKPEPLLYDRIADVRALCAEDLRLRRLTEELFIGATTLERLQQRGPFAPIVVPLLGEGVTRTDVGMKTAPEQA